MLRWRQADPNELHDLAATLPETVAKLTALLKTEVDPAAADGACKAISKDLFRRLFYEPYGGAANCSAMMAYVYQGYNATDNMALEKWLGLPCQ